MTLGSIPQLARLGWSKGEAARRLAVVPAHPEKPAPLMNDAPARAELSRQQKPQSTRAFSPDEQAAIEAALATGKLWKIEQGNWPDANRPVVQKWNR